MGGENIGWKGSEVMDEGKRGMKEWNYPAFLGSFFGTFY
jgi:hypothetical protein